MQLLKQMHGPSFAAARAAQDPEECRITAKRTG